jgi:hypothetical protein
MLRLVFSRATLSLLLLAVLLAACGSDEKDERSFAPETRDGTAAPTETSAPTKTPPPQNRQPGEGSASMVNPADLFNQTGKTRFVVSGIATWAVVDLETGDARELEGGRGRGTLAVTTADGSGTIEIDRSSEPVTVRLFAADGSETRSWRAEESGSPEASPVAAGDTIRIGDSISWNQDGTAAVISIAGLGVFLADEELKMQPVAAALNGTVTSVAWSSSGESIALGIWHGETRAAEIVTVNTRSLDGAGSPVLRLQDQDGRFVRSLAWGSEKVGLVFALRSVSADFALPNDLYYLPRFGEPMRLLASAGIAAPAAVVDQVAMAANGSTVAFTIQVPGDVGLRFHSVWVTDALAPSPVRADTTGLRRVLDLAWGSDGLVASGIRRTQDGGAAYQVASIERLSNEAPAVVAEIRSDATPVTSPKASPVAGTPVA